MNYLTTLYSDLHDGFLAIWHKSNRQTRWFHIGEIDAASDYMTVASEAEDVYFGWGLQDAALGSSRRGESATVCALPGFMMDVDLVSPAHAKTALPPTADAFFEFLAEVGFPEPTAIRNSGNGLYCDWLFPSPLLLAPDEQRARAADLSRRLQNGLIQLGKHRHGWALDNTADLARVTRMPGTRNHKTTPARDVTLVEYRPARRYSIDDIEAAVVALEQKAEGSPRSRRPGEPRQDSKRPTRAEQSESQPSFDAIVAGCAWAGSCVDNAAKLPEPDWYTLAGIVGRCEDGAARFHELSRHDPRYQSPETQKKLEHALSASAPRTCQYIANDLAAEACRNCIFNVHSPISLGYQRPEIAALMRRHVYDVGTRRYREIDNGLMLEPVAFSEKHRHLVAKGRVHDLLMASTLTRKVDAIDYLPGAGHFEERDRVIFNSWTPGPLSPAAGDASIILDHLANLLPREADRSHLLDCLAHAIQRPAEKVRHLLLIIGAQGTGKSFLMHLCSRLFGEQNVRRTESEHLTSAWTERLGNCQALVIEELDTFERQEVYNRLKAWITEEQVIAEEKYVPLHNVRTPRLMLAFSNHRTPVRIQDGDRRFWIVESEAERRDPAYYDRLFREGLSQAAAFLDLLIKRNIDAFNASAAPPVTESKLAIMASSRPVCTQEVETMIDQEHLLFAGDLVRFDTLYKELANRLPSRFVTRAQVTEALRTVGAVPLRQVRMGSEKRVRLWALRNGEAWTQKSGAELRTGHLRRLRLDAQSATLACLH